jgi:tRNA threonylcarbamoyladenosine biosynthesis protein TsaB
MLLALDTSTNFAAIALADGDTLLAELNWRVGQRHGSETLERMRWLLSGQGVTMAQLDGFAVALGPGSFNGVRVALATAKSMAFALDIPLYGVPTLDISAWGARLSPDVIWSLLDAGRGEVYAACYQPGAAAEAWAPQSLSAEDATRARTANGYQILAPEALAACISAPVLFTGEWRPTTHEALVMALGDQARFTSPLTGRRGAWLAELAQARAERGMADDPRALEPLYLRRPAITSSAHAMVSPGGHSSEPRQEQGVRIGGEEAADAL